MLDAEREGVEWEGGDASDAISEYPLAVEVKTIVEIQISTGGPAEWIVCEVSRANYGGYELDRATFHAAWGSDSRETRLDSTDALYQLAERYLEGLEA
jgi:hypothetical protein